MRHMVILGPATLRLCGWAAPFLCTVRKFGVTPYRWAFALAKRMVGAWEKPLRALRAGLGTPSAKLAQELEALFAAPEYATRAQAVSTEVKRESGARTACDRLFRLVTQNAT